MLKKIDGKTMNSGSNGDTELSKSNTNGKPLKIK